MSRVIYFECDLNARPSPSTLDLPMRPAHHWHHSRPFLCRIERPILEADVNSVRRIVRHRQHKFDTRSWAGECVRTVSSAPCDAADVWSVGTFWLTLQVQAARYSSQFAEVYDTRGGNLSCFERVDRESHLSGGRTIISSTPPFIFLLIFPS